MSPFHPNSNITFHHHLNNLNHWFSYLPNGFPSLSYFNLLGSRLKSLVQFDICHPLLSPTYGFPFGQYVQLIYLLMFKTSKNAHHSGSLPWVSFLTWTFRLRQIIDLSSVVQLSADVIVTVGVIVEPCL